MTEHADPDGVQEHPFTRAWRAWQSWSATDTWQRVVADAHEHGRDLSALGELDELTRGPDPLTALRANRELVETLTTCRWHAMRAAREQGYGWQEIGQTLGLDAEQARRTYLEQVDQLRLAADRMPEGLLRYNPHWRDLADAGDTDSPSR